MENKEKFKILLCIMIILAIIGTIVYLVTTRYESKNNKTNTYEEIMKPFEKYSNNQKKENKIWKYIKSIFLTLFSLIKFLYEPIVIILLIILINNKKRYD